ncbi:hypothetical protein EYF80_066092 [Liparis tanakae]|uniref:Uncharacterized protein n=1 Tax=Liparis tanakae TaxID=230148 RepID=A0A4Z2E4E2_9TELE|nr:hypothetical protein EYF80_066092 [Liparis tanakae]
MRNARRRVSREFGALSLRTAACCQEERHNERQRNGVKLRVEQQIDDVKLTKKLR